MTACPYLTQTAEGTGYCTLAEQAVRSLLAERDKLQRRLRATEQKLAMVERYYSVLSNEINGGSPA